MPETFATPIPGFSIRFAEEADCPAILAFIRGLAEYERLSHQVVATEEILADSLFRHRHAEVLLGEYHGEPAAFALFVRNFSTFLGRANLYLEDLFVPERFRGRGFGRQMFLRLAAIAKSRGCARVDWSCLDWNQSAIDFYRGLGARPMDAWTTYRLEGEALERLAERAGRF